MMIVRSHLLTFVLLTGLAGMGALSGCDSCLIQCKCEHHCEVFSVVQKSANTVGVPQSLQQNPNVVVMELVFNASNGDVSTDMLNGFDPSKVSAEVNVQGGSLAVSSGIVSLQVRDANGRTLAVFETPYVVDGNMLRFSDPASVATWINNNGETLIKKGAINIRMAINVPVFQAAGANNVTVRTTVSYGGTALTSASGSGSSSAK